MSIRRAKRRSGRRQPLAVPHHSRSRESGSDPVPDSAQAAEMLASVLTGNDLVLVQGAGNIGKIARHRLKSN